MSMFRRTVRVAPSPSAVPGDRWGLRYVRYSAWSLPVEEEAVGQVESQGNSLPEETEMLSVPPQQRLAHYFQWLVRYRATSIDQDYVRRLVDEGADTNVAYGSTMQRVLHEVAAHWSVAVAALLLEKRADVNATDNGGRTPLHFAAYTNHTEMVAFLLNNGAKLEARTVQQQTVVHYAVRGDSVDALQLLIERGAHYDVCSDDPRRTKDSRGRTPLQLAAELDCTIVAKFLLGLESHPANCAVVDDSGHPALVSMIKHMPKMAHIALDQLHKVYPSKRNQEYQLGLLESSEHAVKTAFEAAVEQRAYNVLTHPVMQKLTSERWKGIARTTFIIYLVLYLLFLLSWSIIIAYPSIQQKHNYSFPQDIWRVILQCIAVLLLVGQIGDEIFEFGLSITKHTHYNQWIQRQLEDDLNHLDCPIFQEEKQFLQSRMINYKANLLKYYLTDTWNLIDVTTYVLLVLTIFMHIADILDHTEALARWTMRVAAIAVILIWVRILKFARASSLLGPLVAIIGQLSSNIVQYFILFAVFWIPYTISFWGLFGGGQVAVNGTNESSAALSDELNTFYRVPVFLFRMSLIDDYPYRELRVIDELMATLLVISFLLITAVIGLNLFIALLSDTFQRVYDNAQANAELQRAQLLLSLQDKVPKWIRRKFLSHLQSSCSPVAEYYDDDEDNPKRRDTSLLKITHQIYRALRTWREESKYEEQVAQLREAVSDLSVQLTSMSAQVDEIRRLLLDKQSNEIMT